MWWGTVDINPSHRWIRAIKLGLLGQGGFPEEAMLELRSNQEMLVRWGGVDGFCAFVHMTGGVQATVVKRQVNTVFVQLHLFHQKVLSCFSSVLNQPRL